MFLKHSDTADGQSSSDNFEHTLDDFVKNINAIDTNKGNSEQNRNIDQDVSSDAKKQRKLLNWKIIFIVVALCLFSAAFITTLIGHFGKKNGAETFATGTEYESISENENDSAINERTNDEPNTERRDDAARDAILVVSDSAAVENSNSPQRKAANWIINEDPLQLDISEEKNGSDGMFKFIQRYTMATLFFSLNGENWVKESDYEFAITGTEWLRGKDECKWRGVFCNKDTNTITRIILAEMNLEGTIPSEISEIKHLKKLDLYGNSISGNIPGSIGNLDNLSFLDLASNGITGNIPITFYNLKDLEYVYLNDNELSGSLSTELGQFTSLQDVRLQRNRLTGTIPSDVGDMESLRIIMFQSNKITGSLPTTIGNLENLMELDLSNNMMTGTLPNTLGNALMLRLIHLNNNSFDGSIPKQIGNFPNLYELSLHDNKLSGSLTTQLGKLIELKSLTLHNNELTGKVSDEVCDLNYDNEWELLEFTTDCKNNEVRCNCCTKCFS